MTAGLCSHFSYVIGIRILRASALTLNRIKELSLHVISVILTFL
jgi:hypothetical protein